MVDVKLFLPEALVEGGLEAAAPGFEILDWGHSEAQDVPQVGDLVDVHLRMSLTSVCSLELRVTSRRWCFFDEVPVPEDNTHVWEDELDAGFVELWVSTEVVSSRTRKVG